MKIIALQTARAGSKSVPNKNLYRVNELPLYLHNVGNALKCKEIEKIYISTDSKEIIDQYSRSNDKDILKLIKRPASLCQDNSSHYEAILQGFNEIEKENGQIDILVMLLGNTPHAYTADLTNAINEFTSKINDFDSCMSVSKFNMFNPNRAFHQLADKSIKPIMDFNVTKFLANRKNLNDRDCFGDILFFNGSFWIIKRQTLLDNNGQSVFPWLGNRIMPYIQPEGYMEIDSEWQLKLL